MKDPNVKTKAIKLLEENTGEQFHKIVFSIGFLYMIPKEQATKEKKQKSDYIKIVHQRTQRTD